MKSLDFVEKLRQFAQGGAWFDDDMPDRDIEGDVDLPRMELNKPLVLKSFHFKGQVDFDNSRFKAKLQIIDCAFEQALNLSQAGLENGLGIIRCNFGMSQGGAKRDEGQLCTALIKLDNARVVGDISLLASDVRGRFSARGLELVGDLNFTSCTIYGKSDSTLQGAVVDLSRSNFKGGVSFEAYQETKDINPPISGTGSDELREDIDKHLQERASRSRSIFGAPGCGFSICLRNARIIDVDLSCASFNGNVSLTDMHGFSVASRGRKLGPKISGKEPDGATGQFQPEQGRQWRSAFTAIIDGDLDFSSSNIGVIRLEGIKVANLIFLIDGESGQIEIDDWCEIGEDNKEVLVVPATCGSFYMSVWHCKEFVRCNFDQVVRDDNEWSIRGLHIVNSKIDRDLTFWPGLLTTRKLLENSRSVDEKFRVFVVEEDSVAADGRALMLMEAEGKRISQVINRWRRGVTVEGRINVVNCDIGGQLDLTAVKVTGADDRNDGRIDIVDTKIGGGVTFSSPVSYLQGRHNGYEFLRRLALLESLDALVTGENDRIAIYDNCARCWSLDMRGLSAQTVDLSGISIASGSKAQQQQEARLEAAQFGYCKIQRGFQIYARVPAASFKELAADITKSITPESVGTGTKDALGSHGMLLMACKIKSEWGTLKENLAKLLPGKVVSGGAETHASIPGKLNLQHAEIGELYLSDHTFNQKGDTNTKGILLDFARVSYLHVRRGQKKEGGETEPHNGFPVPIRLLDMQVGSWNFEEPGGQCENDKADPYLDLLDNEEKFRVSSYTAVEKSLRDRGLDDEADKIFIAGYYRNLRSDVPDGRLRKWRAQDGRPRDAFAVLKQGAAQLWIAVAALLAFGSTMALSGLRQAVALFLIGLFSYVLTDALFGLKRPRGEYRALAGTLGFCFILAVAVAWTAGHPATYIWFLLFPVGYSIIRAPFRESLTLTGDWFYWKFLKYGTNAFPLARVIIALMIATYVLVAGDTRNFEASTQLQIKEQACVKCEDKLEEPDAPGVIPRRSDARHPKEHEWTGSERIWSTLAYHVPVVDLLITDDFEPADGPLYFAGMDDSSMLDLRSEIQGWGKSCWWIWPLQPSWPKARDWFALMQWLNWMLWPLFLPYLIRKLTRSG